MKHIEDIRALTDLLLTSKNFHSLVIEGAPGWGKSTAVEKILRDRNTSFMTLGSYTTPLRLFSFLSQNPKATVIIDDCAGIFGDSIAMSVLKAATWPSSGTDGTRLLSWGTTSEKVAIQEFFFDGKIILLTNRVPTGGDGLAFISRSLHYSITPSAEEMENIVRAIALSDRFPDVKLATEVVACLVEQGKKSDFRGVNLRTLHMGYELAISDRSNWKELFVKLLPAEDPTRLAYIDASSINVSVEEQFREFHRQTGLSRRTFFYHRARSKK